MALDNNNTSHSNINYSLMRSKMVLKSGPPPGRIHSIKTNEPVVPRVRSTRMTARTPLTIADVRRPATLVVLLRDDYYDDDEGVVDMASNKKSMTNLGCKALGKEIALTGIQEPLMLGKRL